MLLKVKMYSMFNINIMLNYGSCGSILNFDEMFGCFLCAFSVLGGF